MKLFYDVTVRNELTGTVEVVRVPSFGVQDAQIDALVTLFKREGWRKAVALQAQPAESAADSTE